MGNSFSLPFLLSRVSSLFLPAHTNITQVNTKPYLYIPFTLQLQTSLKKMQGWEFVYSPSLYIIPSLFQYILFDMPSLHAFVFLYTKLKHCYLYLQCEERCFVYLYFLKSSLMITLQLQQRRTEHSITVSTTQVILQWKNIVRLVCLPPYNREHSIVCMNNWAQHKWFKVHTIFNGRTKNTTKLCLPPMSAPPSHDLSSFSPAHTITKENTA